MEPRPHERGNACQSVWLTNTHATLQWSHVLTNVETSAAVVVWLMENDPSMEPRPHERGNQGLRLASGGPADPSMEPRPHERGNGSVVNSSEKVVLQVVCERLRVLWLMIRRVNSAHRTSLGCKGFRGCERWAGLGSSVWRSRARSEDDGDAVVVAVERAPDGLYALLHVAVARAEVDEHDLILALVYDLHQCFDQQHALEIGRAS